MTATSSQVQEERVRLSERTEFLLHAPRTAADACSPSSSGCRRRSVGPCGGA